MPNTTITVNQLKTALTPILKSNVTPFLVGQPGIGKSSILKDYAKKYLHTKCFVLSVNQLGSREDLTGARAQKDEKTGSYKQVFFPHAIIQECIDYANEHPNETPLLFLDEINRTTSDVTGAVMALITERRIGTTNLPDNIKLVSAGNDKGNVASLDDASTSRTILLHVKPSVTEFFAVQPELNFYIKKVLKQNPELLTAKTLTDTSSDEDDDENDFGEFLDDDALHQITTPRTWTYLSEILNNLGLDGKNLPQNINEIRGLNEGYDSMLYALIKGQLGDTQATEIMWQTLDQSIDDLITSPQTQSTNQSLVPDPDESILDLMYNTIESLDDIDEKFEELNDSPVHHKQLINTFFTLIETQNFSSLKYPATLKRYYDRLLELDELKSNNTVAKTFRMTFIQLATQNQINDLILDHIKSSQDVFSSSLKSLLDQII